MELVDPELCPYLCRDVDQSDRFFRRTAAGAGDAGHRDGTVGLQTFRRAAHHCFGAFGADRAVPGEQFFRYAEQSVFEFVAVDHCAPLEDRGDPGVIGKHSGDSAAGAGFGGDQCQIPFLEQSGDRFDEVEFSGGQGGGAECRACVGNRGVDFRRIGAGEVDPGPFRAGAVGELHRAGMEQFFQLKLDGILPESGGEESLRVFMSGTGFQRDDRRNHRMFHHRFEFGGGAGEEKERPLPPAVSGVDADSGCGTVRIRQNRRSPRHPRLA